MSNESSNTNTTKKTWTRLLLGLLGIQALLELAVGGTLLFNFQTALESGFGIVYNPELDILGIALGLYLLLLTTLIVLSMIWINRANYGGITLAIIIGIFLLSFGMTTFLKFGDSQALLIDGLRGLVTTIFAFMAGKELRNAN